MMKVFKKRGALTRFQILSEISKQNPHLKQKDLAETLGITIQAVSENIKTLIEEGYITSNEGRAPYKITQKGLNKVKKDAVILRKYTDEVLNTMTHFKTVWPAIAKVNLEKGEKVGLYMEKGLLYADLCESAAYGTVLDDAKAGHDVALGDLEGIINLEAGEAVIVTLPPIKYGGSKAANLKLIKELYEKGTRKGNKIDKVAVIGTISHSVAHQLDLPIDIAFAAPQATANAARKGLNVFILCVGEMNKSFIRQLDEEGITYSIFDGRI